MSAPPVGRVLVVDDEPDLAGLITLALRRFGLDARAAHGASAALEATGELDPHVILLDLHLPDTDGHELGRALRARSRRTVQIVAVTSDDRPEAHARSAEYGFAAHLVKPVPLRDLARIVTVLQLQARAADE